MNIILDFLSMHGHGFYVWTAYGCVGIFLFTQWLHPWRRWRKYLLNTDKHS